jgi:serine/threonine-protein kinase
MSFAITVTIADGCPARQRYVFTKPARCLVGRAEDCAIRFPTDMGHSTISRHHCLLTIKPNGMSVRDLGSLTGTYVNGRPIGQRRPDQPREAVDPRTFAARPLKEGDEVRIGPVTLRVG